MGCPFSRAIEDQQLVFDEHGFGYHGTGAAGTGEPDHGRQQMQKKDGQIAHGAMLSRSRHGEECSGILEFAMHRSNLQESSLWPSWPLLLAARRKSRSHYSPQGQLKGAPHDRQKCVRCHGVHRSP